MCGKLLEIHRVSLSFGGLRALDDASLSVEEGKVFALIGPNGAGKTTLFNIIAGALVADSGRITFMGKDITHLKRHDICRAGISRTFQLKNLFPNLTVFDNVAAGMLKDSVDINTRRKKIFEILDFLGIGGIADSIVSNITPLEAKFVELGRALATSPKLILLDELIGGLLPSETDKVCDIVEVLRDRGYTILQVGHEIRSIMRTSDWVFVLDQGRNVADGPPEDIRCNSDVLACYLE